MIDSLAVLAAVLAGAVYGGVALAQHVALGRSPSAWMVPLPVRNRAWRFAVLAQAAALGLQILALDRERVTVVSPLVLSGTASTALLLAAWQRHSPPRSAVVGAVLVIAGTSGFLAAVVSTDDPPLTVDARGLAVVAMAPVLLLTCAVGRPKCPGSAAEDARTTLLVSLAAGCLLGIAACLLKVVVTEYANSAATVVLTWPLYALTFCGAAGFTASQCALAATNVAAPLAVMSVTEQVTAVGGGIWLLGETMRTGDLAHFLAAGAGIVALTGCALLQRRPQSAVGGTR